MVHPAVSEVELLEAVADGVVLDSGVVAPVAGSVYGDVLVACFEAVCFGVAVDDAEWNVSLHELDLHSVEVGGVSFTEVLHPVGNDKDQLSQPSAVEVVCEHVDVISIDDPGGHAQNVDALVLVAVDLIKASSVALSVGQNVDRLSWEQLPDVGYDLLGVLFAEELAAFALCLPVCRACGVLLWLFAGLDLPVWSLVNVENGHYWFVCVSLISGFLGGFARAGCWTVLVYGCTMLEPSFKEKASNQI